MPATLVRSILWLLTHSVYRLRTYGAENIPASGPALLVANHVTYLDWLFIVAAQKRHVHFVIFAGWTRRPILGKLLNWAGVVPIDHTGGPRAIVKSLKAAGELLSQGKLVCIFAEGRFTRTGFLLPFKRGFEQILKHSPAPIVPVYLDRAWGSILSYYKGKLIWKRPSKLPYTVGVAFGKPLPATATSFEVRQALQLLSAEAMIARRDELVPPVRQFQKQARRHPFRPCLLASSASEKTLSYGVAFMEAACLARSLKRTVGEGGPAIVHTRSSQTAAIANIACAMLNKMVVNVDPRDSIQRKFAICSQPHCDLVWLAEGEQSNWLERGEETCEIFLPIDLAQERHAITLGDRICAFLTLFTRSVGVAPVDMAGLVFPEAPTGDQLVGVMLTNANLAANCESLRQTIGPDPSDRCLGALPLADSFGLTVTLWLPLTAGASVAFCDPAAKSEEIGAVCRYARCTVLAHTASRLAEFVSTWPAEDAAALRLVVCAGEPLNAELAERIQSTWNVTPLPCYGRHELSPAAIVSVPDASIDDFTQRGAKIGAVGQPLPGVAVKIVDPVTRQPLGPGQTGELLVYGANVSPGYYCDEKLTAQCFVDGWFLTGDLAMMDDDGFVTIVPPVV